VDHSIIDQTSILRFIEDNWNLGRIGDQSFDAKAGSILGMFDFTSKVRAQTLFLDPNMGALITSKTTDLANRTNQAVIDPLTEIG